MRREAGTLYRQSPKENSSDASGKEGHWKPRPAKTGRKRGPAKMTAEHKQALAEGREASRHVRAYLEALDANKPKRGRKRTKDTVQRQLDEVKDQIGPATGLRKLELAQRRIDLETELDGLFGEGGPERAASGLREARQALRQAQGDLLQRLARSRCPRRGPEGRRDHPGRSLSIFTDIHLVSV